MAPETAATVRAHLACLSGKPVAERDVRAVFRSFGRYLVEFFSMHRGPLPGANLDDTGSLKALLAAKQGFILLTAHLGNWELGAAWARQMGARLAVIAMPHASARTDRLFSRQRERCGITVLPYRLSGARKALRWLREGGVVGVLGDLPFDSQRIQGTLGGLQAELPTGPAWLSRQAGVPLVPSFLIRQADERFHFFVESPIEPMPERDERSDIERMVRLGALAMEKYMRKYPTQWLVFRRLATSVEMG